MILYNIQVIIKISVGSFLHCSQRKPDLSLSKFGPPMKYFQKQKQTSGKYFYRKKCENFPLLAWLRQNIIVIQIGNKK